MLSPERQLEIVEAHQTRLDKTVDELAAEFGVCVTTVYNTLRRNRQGAPASCETARPCVQQQQGTRKEKAA